MKPAAGPAYRAFVVGVLFLFSLLHQADKLLIGPLATPIMETFQVNELQMGAVFTGALVVGAILYPLWGYLGDRFSRARLLALACFLWGSTTWISAGAPSFRSFLTSRASTGIDDSSYPAMYSLVADYFPPGIRGRVYALLQAAQPLGYLGGAVAATLLADPWGWRRIFLLTAGLGLALSVVLALGLREPRRGQAEPELAALGDWPEVRFNLRQAAALVRKPSLVFLFLQGFVGVFPWNVISYWFFRYLETERGYDPTAVLITMVPVIVVLSAGFYLGGALGDWGYRRNPRGRLAVSIGGVLLGAVLLPLSLSVPVAERGWFLGLLLLSALAIPLSSPNVVATVYEVTLPEVRSTALSVQYFIESAGSALAPLIAGAIAVRANLHTAILTTAVSAWALTAVFLSLAAWRVPADAARMRSDLRLRAEASGS